MYTPCYRNPDRKPSSQDTNTWILNGELHFVGYIKMYEAWLNPKPLKMVLYLHFINLLYTRSVLGWASIFRNPEKLGTSVQEARAWKHSSRIHTTRLLTVCIVVSMDNPGPTSRRGVHIYPPLWYNCPPPRCTHPLTKDLGPSMHTTSEGTWYQNTHPSTGQIDNKWRHYLPVSSWTGGNNLLFRKWPLQIYFLGAQKSS